MHLTFFTYYTLPCLPVAQIPDCSSVSSCNQLDPTAAFRHKDGTYIVLYEKEYWVYNSVHDMCYGAPVSGPNDFDDLVDFNKEPEMLASINNGQDLFVFRSM